MRPPGILCSGSIVDDTLVYPYDGLAWGTTQWVQELEHHVGGNGANTARAIGLLGTPVRLLGAVGTDACASAILSQLGRSGVDVSKVAQIEAPTAASIVLVNRQGGRQFLHRLGVSRQVFRELIEFTPETCHNISHYHLASLFTLPQVRLHAPEMLRRARAAGLTTSLDTNWDPESKWMKVLEPCLMNLDILFMNEDEAQMVTGSTDPSMAAAAILAKGTRTAVMKLGGRGCAVFAEGRRFDIPAFDVNVKDTTGAGDCFVAGFLTALQDGASWDEAGEIANAVGALSVQQLGAVTGVLPLSQTKAWAAKAPRKSEPSASLGSES